MCSELRHKSVFEVQLRRSSSVPDLEEYKFGRALLKSEPLALTPSVLHEFSSSSSSSNICRDNLWMWMDFLEGVCLPASLSMCVCVCVRVCVTAMTFHYHLFMRGVVYFVLACAAPPLVNTNLNRAINKSTSSHAWSSLWHLPSRHTLPETRRRPHVSTTSLWLRRER